LTGNNNTTNFKLLEPILEKFSGRRREALLPLLHEAQSLFGWLPEDVQQAVGETLRVPLADVHGVIEFYTMFYNSPTAKRVVRVCEDSACHLAGSGAVISTIESRLGIKPGETDEDNKVTYEHVPCLGMCDLAPAALNAERPAGNLTVADVDLFLEGLHPEPRAIVYGGPRLLTSRIGKVDPGSLDEYINKSGFEALGKAMEMEPDGLIDLLESSGILGRGGAMFPIGRKWRFARSAQGNPNQKHILVNGDESEPSTFKDRCLMEEDPFAVIEGALIAAYAVGAENGWIFVRGEYPRCYARLEEAVRQAKAAGFLGRTILGRIGFNFNIEMRRGAGAYICGEETALCEAIEGRRGFPRIRPPFPVTEGLFRQPTAINNVETLVCVVAALEVGIDQWRKLGTAQSPGTKLFCVSGHVQRPGLYELPFGVTIRSIIEMAGGVPGGNDIQAVLLGGAAGVFLGPDGVDMPLTYEDSRTRQVPLGSGVIMVLDRTVNLHEVAYQLARFFVHESCGKCFPCQLGTQRQMEILGRMAFRGGVKPTDKRDLLDIGFTMTQTSLCGLGQTAGSAVLSAINLWPELFE
jgi:NADH-quinone oxidoreductase subunit F